MWDMYQNMGTARAQATATSAAGKAADLTANLSNLVATIDRMLMVNRAMWEILRDARGLTDEDLRSKMEEIDLRDGKLDGRLRKPVVDCPECGRTMQRVHPRCLYCGAEGEPDVFDM